MYRGNMILINNKDVINDANKMLELLKGIFLKKYNCFENIPNCQNITLKFRPTFFCFLIKL